MSGVPGSNLLVDALDLIESQPVSYQQTTGWTTNAAGRNEPSYAPAVDVTVGSVQAVNKDRYQILGLDLQKEYVMWYVPQSVVGTQRNSKGDLITYAGHTYQLESTVNWFAQDGWMSIACVQVA